MRRYALEGEPALDEASGGWEHPKDMDPGKHHVGLSGREMRPGGVYGGLGDCSHGAVDSRLIGVLGSSDISYRVEAELGLCLSAG